MEDGFSFLDLIIKVLFTNTTVRDKVIPFLTDDWFKGDSELRLLVSRLISYMDKYHEFPSELEAKTLLKSDPTLSSRFNEILSIKTEEVENSASIIDSIEHFIKHKLMYEVATDIQSSVLRSDPDSIQDPLRVDNEETFTDKLREAESFSLEFESGFDLLDDLGDLYENINNKNARISTGLCTLDDLFNGGVPEKVIIGIMAPTNIGKTLILSSIAANMLLDNKNVLYVTFEDSKDKIASRMIQSLSDLTQLDLKRLNKSGLCKLSEIVKDSTDSKLKIIELEECAVSSNRLETIIKDMRDKEKFTPDVIFIDYIGCMIPNGKTNIYLNSNSILQKIVAEVRGSIVMKLGVPVLTAFQTNRSAYGNVSIDLNDIADSYGSTTKVDVMLAITQNREMLEFGIYKVFVAKTRLKNNKNTEAVIRVDIDKQQIFDEETYNQNGNSNPQNSPHTKKLKDIREKTKSLFKDVRMLKPTISKGSDEHAVQEDSKSTNTKTKSPQPIENQYYTNVIMDKLKDL